MASFPSYSLLYNRFQIDYNITITLLPSPKVVRCLIPSSQNHLYCQQPHFCRPSWLSPGQSTPHSTSQYKLRLVIRNQPSWTVRSQILVFSVVVKTATATCWQQRLGTYQLSLGCLQDPGPDPGWGRHPGTSRDSPNTRHFTEHVSFISSLT